MALDPTNPCGNTCAQRPLQQDNGNRFHRRFRDEAFGRVARGEEQVSQDDSSFSLQVSGRHFSETEAHMGILLLVALLLLLFGIVGGIAISKFLFLILIVALIIGAIGFFTRRTA
ncbi:MAG: hypothetical protein ACM3QU_13740 [Verrucomicrobiota bacterium]